MTPHNQAQPAREAEDYWMTEMEGRIALYVHRIVGNRASDEDMEASWQAIRSGLKARPPSPSSQDLIEAARKGLEALEDLRFVLDCALGMNCVRPEDANGPAFKADMAINRLRSALGQEVEAPSEKRGHVLRLDGASGMKSCANCGMGEEAFFDDAEPCVAGPCVSPQSCTQPCRLCAPGTQEGEATNGVKPEDPYGY